MVGLVVFDPSASPFGVKVKVVNQMLEKSGEGPGWATRRFFLNLILSFGRATHLLISHLIMATV